MQFYASFKLKIPPPGGYFPHFLCNATSIFKDLCTIDHLALCTMFRPLTIVLKSYHERIVFHRNIMPHFFQLIISFSLPLFIFNLLKNGLRYLLCVKGFSERPQLFTPVPLRIHRFWLEQELEFYNVIQTNNFKFLRYNITDNYLYTVHQFVFIEE